MVDMNNLNLIPGNNYLLNNSTPATGGGGKNKKKDKNGINQLQQNLINSIAKGLIPQLNKNYQSTFQSNVKPELFNFDPSKVYQGYQGMTGAKIDFNPSQYLGNTAQANAALSNYDPSSWLNRYDTNANAFLSNFDPNMYNSQSTSDFIASIGSDANLLTGIRNNMAGISGLPSLDPETQAYLNQITAANTGQINQQFNLDKELLLEDLYGRGLNTSTIANDAAGKLLYGRDQLTQQEQANAANRAIGLQQNIRDFNLQNLVQQAGTVRDQYSAKAQQASLSQTGDLARMQAGLQNNLANAQAQNNASLANAANNLQLAMAGNQTASQVDLFNTGNQQQVNLANAQAQNQNNQILAQLMQQIAIEQGQLDQGTNQFNAQADLGIRDNINNYLANIGMFNTQNINQANQFNTSNNMQVDQNNLQALLQQLGIKTDFLTNMTNQFFNRKMGNKQLNLQQLQLELERQQQAKQLEFQYAQLAAQIQQQKGGLFGKIFGAVAPLALNFIPGIGTAASASIGSFNPRKYVRGS